jgi:flagellar hook-associated protein 3 FlgL
MITGIDAAAERFLTDLSSTKERQARAQREISSGYRLNRASDDPDQVKRLVSLEADLDRSEQIETNLGLFKAETDAAERALAAAVDVLDKLSVLGAQGSSEVIGADKRRILGDQARAWLERLVAIANTAAGGRYIFSGDSDQVAPYTLDLTQLSGVSAYGGTAATRQAEDVSGGRFGVAQPGDAIFDDSSGSVFGAANALRVALESDDSAAIDQALAVLAAARSHLNQQHAGYGTVQNRIAAEIRAAGEHQLELKEQITAIRETDFVEASLALVSAGTQVSAALAARGRQQLPSLFDYLG